MIIINRSYIIHTEILHYLRSWGQEIISHHLHGNNSVLHLKNLKNLTQSICWNLCTVVCIQFN